MSCNRDRHKTPRVFQTGAEKRKNKKEQAKLDEQVLSKTRRMTDFITLQPGASKSDHETPTVTYVSDSDSVNTSTNSKTVAASSAVATEAVHTANANDDIAHCDGIMSGGDEILVTSLDESSDVGLQQTSDEHLGETVSAVDDDDVGMWPERITKPLVDFWVKEHGVDLQHCDDDLFKLKSSKQKGGYESSRTRRCTPSTFERHNQNGEIVNRSWLCFSPTNGRVYCYVCKLLSASRTQFTHGGFCDWKHASDRLSDHERSKSHLDAVVALAHRAKEAGRVDFDLAQQAEQVENYWRSVLKRLISVTKFSCERGLALRGEDETICSAANGNYLGMLELLAQYDDFLKQHIQKHGNLGTGHTNYLSSTICEELVELMGKRVLDEIVSRIKRSRYYSVTLDYTPDEGHVDQLTLVFRFMENTTPVERFVTSMPNQGHKAEEMFDGLMKFLDTHGIDIKHCRGQSYDNASAMSGRYNGLQAKVAARNNLAAWNPCAGHSLNLVVKAAAECCSAAVSFFDILECVSTHRYEVLTNALRSADRSVCVPKRINTIRGGRAGQMQVKHLPRVMLK